MSSSSADKYFKDNSFYKLGQDDGSEKGFSSPNYKVPENFFFVVCTIEECQKLGNLGPFDSVSSRNSSDKSKDHLDHYKSPEHTIIVRVESCVIDSYTGMIKFSVERFEQIEGSFREIIPRLGNDKAHFCLEVGTIYYRGYLDEKSLDWLKQARKFSQELQEEDDPRHFRRLYLCLADISIKKGDYEDARSYWDRARDVIHKYLKTDTTEVGYKCLSWLKALQGHLLTNSKQYEEAEQYYKASIYWKKKYVKNYQLHALGKDYLVEFYILKKDLNNAELQLKRAVKTSEKIEKGFFTKARHARNQARIAFLKGEKENSEKYYREAFAILKEELPSGNSLEALYKKEFEEILRSDVSKKTLDVSLA